MSRWKTILAIDFEKNAEATYAANFPEVEVRCASVADEIGRLPYADVICAGPPCQPHSLAGQRGASSDQRDCGPDFVAAVAKVRPRHFLMENVPGFLSSENGHYWHRLYAGMEAAGYVIEYRVQDAVSFGVPQFRERLWVWGVRRDVHASGIRHNWPKATHAWPPPGECMFGAALLPGVTVGQALNVYGSVLAIDSTMESPCATISAGSHQGGPEPVNNRKRAGFVRRLTPLECARLQSAPDDFRWPAGISKTAMYRVIGNGWACAHAAAFSRAMAEADPQSKTVIDLFCGGGLGAVGWHQRYWSYES